ncbi:hypothetical protein Poli38472_002264 [Pythium oligandrum]|uniref:MULE transposase domain-containing protein n=1 Tax=Pythium oligandrum TaxID=41045 RepID=A0A8K1CIZ3_PYTOL|nr:hypothetical protein Poli38472_002264 [Pythium oligandrum]|eukprot:TMW63323.1 hypothetical protein Poli38472_002264 [Pythium oligandrum]
MAETAPKKVWSWELVETLDSAFNFDEFRREEFCCSSILTTDNKKYACRLCPSSVVDAHNMVERRLECVSPACGGKKSGCPVMWRVFSCEKASVWKVYDSAEEHKRDVDSGCGGTHNPRITDEMKDYIMEQDDANQTPRMIHVNMQESSAITWKPETWPSLSQVQNCVKYLKRRYGTKNSIRAVRKMVREHHYHADVEENTPLIFGAEDDEEGCARVGEGDGKDPFLLGVTTPALVNASIKFANKGPDAVFHMDATYKLSDLGYRTVTCGFTDAARSYQLAAIIVISTQTADDYESCLKALVKIFKRVQPGVSLKILRFMGDGDHAHFNAMKKVPEFSSASYLMCFFHVLYNVRKKTRHLTDVLRRIIMDGIVEMHYAASESEYEELKQSVLVWWWSFSPLRDFVRYFQKQWLEGKFNRWQIWHTSYGLPTTNNPCETFNATLKVYSGRRRQHMQRLLEMFFKVVKHAKKLEPTKPAESVPPSRELKKAAKSLLDSGKLVVYVSRTTNGDVDGEIVLVISLMPKAPKGRRQI